MTVLVVVHLADTAVLLTPVVLVTARDLETSRRRTPALARTCAGRGSGQPGQPGGLGIRVRACLNARQRGDGLIDDATILRNEAMRAVHPIFGFGERRLTCFLGDTALWFAGQFGCTTGTWQPFCCSDVLST
ncbi:hypothetical protein [Actinokineospora spheciospongiae]|uniref:hypothetical protein n=1 Tax=Actinokineospora spheciospongiae TaxID=909613 RepID=UPI00126810B0|nr:hypothetical protein [Actinokineospora spheciospongiae]